MNPQAPNPAGPPSTAVPSGVPVYAAAQAVPQAVPQQPVQPIYAPVPAAVAPQPMEPVAQPVQYAVPPVATQPYAAPAYPAAQAMYAAPVAAQQAAPVPASPGPVVSSNTLPAAADKPTTPQAPRTNPNSTQNALEIAEIRDGIVIMNDGSYRSVVMVKSINFDLMSQQEQEAVEYSYQGFLNSLYFPVQIFLRSQKVDLQPYIDKLDKIRTEHDNMLLALLMDDYIGYIDGLAQQTNIMDKKFYVVIPYFTTTDMQKALTQSKTFLSGITRLFSGKQTHIVINESELEQAKTELRNRVQSVLGGLMQCGVQGLPLDTQELIELYYDSYNPDTATRQQLKNFNDLTADIIEKGEGSARQPHLQKELQ